MTLTVSAMFVLMVGDVVRAEPDCTCRYKGEDIALGQMVCMSTPNGPRMAQCDRVLNNTSWKITDGPCPAVQAPGAASDLQTLTARLTIPAPQESADSNQ